MLTAKSHHEPLLSPLKFTLHPSSTGDADLLTANLTCHACRPFLPPNQPTSTLIFALGPGGSPVSTPSSPSALLRRHVAHGRFTISTAIATSPEFLVDGGTDSTGLPLSRGATLEGGGAVPSGRGKAGLAHGVVLTVAVLAVMPIDAVLGMAVAGGRGGGGRLGVWGAWVSGGVGGVVVVLVVVGLVLGVGAAGETRFVGFFFLFPGLWGGADFVMGRLRRCRRRIRCWG